MARRRSRIGFPALLFVALLWWSQAAAVRAGAGEYLHDAWTTGNGLPQNDVMPTTAPTSG